MRVTDGMLYDQTSYNVNQAESSVQTYDDQSSTGVRVSHPWDDPGAAALAVNYQMAGARFGAISQEVTNAASELSSADVALNSVGNALQQAIVLAQEMGSGIFTPAQQSSAVEQVTGIQSSIVGLLNSQVGSRYIFGGSKDSAAPFDAAGNYSGDGAVRQVEVAPGVLQNASVNAAAAIKGAGGGVDLFASLGALATALSSNNSAAIQGTEANLQAALQQVFQARSTEGGDAEALQSASSVNQVAQLGQTEDLSSAVDVDEATAASQLAQAQTVLQASISASEKVFQMSILNVTSSTS